jgi:hypothetical protein
MTAIVEAAAIDHSYKYLTSPSDSRDRRNSSIRFTAGCSTRRRAMRYTLLAMSILMMVAGTTGRLVAQPKGARATIRGEVVDLWCYLEGGDRGPAKKECATACAKAGNPIGIVDAKGNVYVAAGLKDHQPAQAILVNRMSDEVTVSGTVVKSGGVQMIYVDSVK